MPDVDPQQIMRQIEQELALRKTEKAGFDRNAFRIWALALIVGGMFAALWALQFYSIKSRARNTRKRLQ